MRAFIQEIEKGIRKMDDENIYGSSFDESINGNDSSGDGCFGGSDDNSNGGCFGDFGNNNNDYSYDNNNTDTNTPVLSGEISKNGGNTSSWWDKVKDAAKGVGSFVLGALGTLGGAVADYDEANQSVKKYMDDNDAPQNDTSFNNLLTQRREALQDKSKQWLQDINEQHVAAQKAFAQQIINSNAQNQQEAEALSQQMAQDAQTVADARNHIARMQAFNENNMHSSLDNEVDAARNTLNNYISQYTGSNSQNSSYPQQTQSQQMQIGTLPTLGGESSYDAAQSQYNQNLINNMFNNNIQPEQYQTQETLPSLEDLKPLPYIPDNTSSTQQPQSQNASTTGSFSDNLFGMPPAYGDTLKKAIINEKFLCPK